MLKKFEMDYGIEELEVDYIVLIGAYDNEHPKDHYSNRRSCGKVYETLDRAKEVAEGQTDAKIWEVAHAIDTGDIMFVTQM